jgi:hypothetical protein
VIRLNLRNSPQGEGYAGRGERDTRLCDCATATVLDLPVRMLPSDFLSKQLVVDSLEDRKGHYGEVQRAPVDEVMSRTGRPSARLEKRTSLVVKNQVQLSMVRFPAPKGATGHLPGQKLSQVIRKLYLQLAHIKPPLYR